MNKNNKIYDVIIIGAGISGVGMACRLQQECPEKSFLLLERRERIGGTWDLMRYPGIRSDSDMYTFGYQFYPWRSYQTLADGDSIRNYINDAAATFDVEKHFEYQVHCQSANWDSQEQLWTVIALHQGLETQYQCRFLINAAGYYNYDEGYRPQFEGEENFKGDILHPQHWPQDYDYTGKKVAVIGSGATAVTLVPTMANKASHVTMVQRSPTYIYSLPAHDRMTEVLDKFLPKNITYSIARWRNLQMWQGFYQLCRRYPKVMRKFITGQTKRLLGDKFNDNDFSPAYQPWDQRLCAVPDADLYEAIKSQKASIATGHIQQFTADGIKLTSGEDIKADVIVTATGLNTQVFGGMQMYVDGQEYEAGTKLIYKSVLMEGLPNYSWIFGYINLSWTMKADMSSLYLCRLFKYMQEHKIAVVVPQADANDRLDKSILDQLSAGYVQRGSQAIPRQGKQEPWVVLHNYKQDKKMMLKTPIHDPQHLKIYAAHNPTTKTKEKHNAA